MIDPHAIFHSPRYLRSTFRCLEHLAALSLPLESRTVLEVGAGIGDFTSFFLDRGCRVTSVEPREENVAIFRARYAQDPLWEAGRLRIVQSTIADLGKNGVEPHDVVAAHQVLNFVHDPEAAIAVLASYANELLFLEAACDASEGRDREELQAHEVDASDPGGSITGVASLPSRRWLFNRLKRHFPYVYVALLQGHFDRFRLYWGRPDTERGQSRVLFIASRAPLDNPLFVDFIPTIQFRCLPGAADLLLPDGMRFVKTVFGPMITVPGDAAWQLPNEEFDALLLFVGEGDIVYDLGAGIGMYAIAFGICVGERGTVVASEHRQAYSAALERNVHSHGTRIVRCDSLADCGTGPVALLRMNAAGMSDRDRSIAASIIDRDRPVVYADDPREAERIVERLDYVRSVKSAGALRGVLYLPPDKQGLA